jgi:hypothetical protein
MIPRGLCTRGDMITQFATSSLSRETLGVINGALTEISRDPRFPNDEVSTIMTINPGTWERYTCRQILTRIRRILQLTVDPNKRGYSIFDDGD